jgi:hypothetical protein
MAAKGTDGNLSNEQMTEVARQSSDFFGAKVEEVVPAIIEDKIAEGLDRALGETSRLHQLLKSVLDSVNVLNSRVTTMEKIMAAAAPPATGGAGAGAVAVNPTTRAAPPPQSAVAVGDAGATGAVPADGTPAVQARTYPEDDPRAYRGVVDPSKPDANPRNFPNNYWKFMLARFIGPSADSTRVNAETGANEYIVDQLAAILNTYIAEQSPSTPGVTSAQLRQGWEKMNKKARRDGATPEEKQSGAATAIITNSSILTSEQRRALNDEWMSRCEAADKKERGAQISSS